MYSVPRESVPELGPSRFFWSSRSMLMRPERRGINEQLLGCAKILLLECLPDTSPHAALLPSTETHVYRMPVTQFSRQIPPRASSPVDVKNGFNKIPF